MSGFKSLSKVSLNQDNLGDFLKLQFPNSIFKKYELQMYTKKSRF